MPDKRFSIIESLRGRVTAMLFFVLMVALAIPPKHGPFPWWLLGLAAIAEAARRLHGRLHSTTAEQRNVFGDVAGLAYAGLLAWHVATAHFRWLDAMFFPPPETIARLFWRELPGMLAGAGGSLVKLASGFLLALAAGVALGLIGGWNRRLYHAFVPLAKALGPVPPVIYIPYAICFLPGLRFAQIFVIFIGAFWPVFLSTLNGVQNIPQKHLDAARALNLRGLSLLRRVILPGALPSLCAGAVLGLVFSFILLTAAELIGSSSGVGWYIKNHADFGDFSKVIAGIVFIGLLVFAVTAVSDRIERRLLRWQD